MWEARESEEMERQDSAAINEWLENEINQRVTCVIQVSDEGEAEGGEAYLGVPVRGCAELHHLQLMNMKKHGR